MRNVTGVLAILVHRVLTVLEIVIAQERVRINMWHCEKCENKHYVISQISMFAFLCQCECHINRSDSTTDIVTNLTYTGNELSDIEEDYEN